MARKLSFGLAFLMSTTALLVSSGAAAQSKGEIRIGLINPTTGIFAVTGLNAKKGVDLALAEARKNPAFKDVTLTLIERDSAGKVPDAIRYANELISRERVDVLMGGQSSAECLALQKLVTEEKIAYLPVSGCWADQFSEQGNVSKYSFRVTASNKQRNQAFAKWLVQNRGAKWYVLYSDYVFGQSGFAAFQEAMKAVGGVIVGSAGVPPGTTDMAPYMSKVIASGADGVYLVFAGRDAVLALQEAASQGLAQKLRLAGMQSLVIPEAFPKLPQAANGLAYIGSYPREMSGPLTTPANKEFRTAYAAMFPSEEVVGLNAFEAYQAVNALLLAIEKSGFRSKGDTEKLVQVLSGLTLPAGKQFPAGAVTIRQSDHQGVAPLYIVVINNGVEQVVHAVPASEVAAIK